MAYHSDFWVVTGTAAPVIALSSVVLLSDQTSLLIEVLGSKGLSRLTYYLAACGCASFAFIFNIGNIITQTTILFVSLQTLTTESERVMPYAVTKSMVAGLVLLVMTLVLSPISKSL
jgi:hypothetical protein